MCLDGVDGRDYVEALTAAPARYDEDSDDPRSEAQWRASSAGDGSPPVADRPADDGQMLFADGVCVGGPRGRLDSTGPGPRPPHLESDPVGWFGLARGDYMQRRAARLLPTAGLITREGEWLDPDRTPSGGSDPAASNLNWFRIRLAYFAQADAYLRALPPECFVVRVRVRT